MNREQKTELVSEVRSDTDKAGLIVVVQMLGLNAGATASLRRKVSEGQATLRVVKNRLAKLAFKDTRYENLIDLMKGPTALAYSADPIAAAKVIADFSNDNDKLQIVGGMMGDKMLDKNAVMALSKLPSLDQLRGKLIGLLQAPATKVAGVVQAPAGQLARVIAAYGNKAGS